jgi:hypothetical protein
MGLDDIIGADYPHDIIGHDGYAQYGADLMTGGDAYANYGADIMTGNISALAHPAQGTMPQHWAHRSYPVPHPMHPHPMHAAAQQRAAAMEMLKLRHAAALAPRPLMKSREYTLGFQNAPVTITSLNTQVLRASPQVPFKGRRLIIPSDVAGALQINQFVVGKNPVLVSSDPVSARAYTEVGVGVDLNMDTAQIAQVISLSMTNNSGASVAVIPTLIGTAIE